MNAKILLVDDEPAFVKGLTATLAHHGYAVVTAHDGDEAWAKLRSEKPDLVLLDVMLPGMDGMTLCQRIRQAGPTPVIMLTARSDDVDRILGLELGADDYVVKPFNARELLARIRAVLRRSAARGGTAPWDPGEVLCLGRLEVDMARCLARLDGHPLDLTPREFDLLAFLARRPDRVFTREQLLRQVWGDDYFGDDRTVDVHVRRLREKIETDPARPDRLLTLRGRGYLLATEGFGLPGGSPER